MLLEYAGYLPQNAGQIEAIKAAYEAEKGDPLMEMIESELKGDLEWAMLLRIKNPIEAKAWLLHFAMDGVGTSEDIISVGLVLLV